MTARIHATVRDGDIDALRSLLRENQHDLNFEHSPWGTALHVAVRCERYTALRMLLDAGADPLLEHCQGLSSWTAIQLAAVRGDERAMQELWYRVDPDIHASQKPSYLALAACYGHPGLVDHLLEHWDEWSAVPRLALHPGSAPWKAALGPAPREHLAFEKDALSYAVQRWEPKVTAVLLRRCEYDEAFRYDMLRAACRTKILLPDAYREDYEEDDHVNQRAVVTQLIESGLDPNASPSSESFRKLAPGYTVASMASYLHTAARRTVTIGALGALLDKGADVEVKDTNGQTVLHRLTSPVGQQSGGPRKAIHYQGIDMLLRYGASVTARNTHGETPLHSAAHGLPLGVFLMLVSSQRPEEIINLKTDQGQSLLHYAAAGGNLEVLEYLLGQGFDVNETTRGGWTPFLCALTRSSWGEKTGTKALHAARMLLEHGANPNVSTDEGWTPLHGIASYQLLDETSASIANALVEELIAQGMNINSQATVFRPESTSSRAIWCPSSWSFRLNATREESPGAARRSFTPLTCAAIHWSVGVARILLANGANPLAADEKGSTPEVHARYASNMPYVKEEFRGEMLRLLRTAAASKSSDS